MPQFWRLTHDAGDQQLAEWTPDVKFESLMCPADPGHRRTGRRLTNLSVFLPRRTKDVVWSWLGDCLIQDKVLRLLQDHEITGYETRPVKAQWKRKWASHSSSHIPTLWELVVTGWGGSAGRGSGVGIDASKSCTACGHTVYTDVTDYKRLIDGQQWDGSDFFMVWPIPRWIFVTERVVELLKTHHITGVMAQPVESLGSSTESSRLTPGRLVDWMPEHVAEERGRKMTAQREGL